MGTDDKLLGEHPQIDQVSEELEDAVARLRGATEELPPLDELAALQEDMAGLEQMGAVLQSLRRTSWGNREAEEEPADERDS
jgi:hypothetical protein